MTGHEISKLLELDKISSFVFRFFPPKSIKETWGSEDWVRREGGKWLKDPWFSAVEFRLSEDLFVLSASKLSVTDWHLLVNFKELLRLVSQRFRFFKLQCGKESDWPASLYFHCLDFFWLILSLCNKYLGLDN